MSSRKEFLQRLTSSDLPTGWLKFFVMWRLPISIIISTILEPLNIVKMIMQIKVTGYDFGDSAYFAHLLLELALLVFLYFAYFHMIKLSPLGYKLGMVLIFSEPAIGLVSLLLFFSERNVVVQVVRTILFVINYIYFKKRKHLFEKQVTTEQNEEHLDSERNNLM